MPLKLTHLALAESDSAAILLIAFIGYVPTKELLLELHIRETLRQLVVHRRTNEGAIALLRAELRNRAVADDELERALRELDELMAAADTRDDDVGTGDHGGGRGAGGRGSDPPGAHGPAHDDARNYPTDGGYGA
jgi:hypothetical protein